MHPGAAPTIRFLGTGDAFGDGGRLQACILLESAGYRALLDCGATSLVALKKFGVEPASIDAVILTHYHGDHAGGVPYLILDGQFSKRTRPLTVAGPAPARERIAGIFEAALPTSSTTQQRFDVHYLDLRPEGVSIGPLSVLALPVTHLPATEPRGIRVSVADRVVAYTGDTEWCEALPALADGADLLIAECYSFDKEIPLHLSHAALLAHGSELHAKRIVLTHPGPEVLARVNELQWTLAEDGQSLPI